MIKKNESLWTLQFNKVVPMTLLKNKNAVSNNWIACTGSSAFQHQEKRSIFKDVYKHQMVLNAWNFLVARDHRESNMDASSISHTRGQ